MGAADIGQKWSNSSIARPCSSPTHQSPTSLTLHSPPASLPASQGRTPLHFCGGHTAIAAALMAMRADVNAEAEALMVWGADVNAKNVSGQEPGAVA